jgi:hypothetical protein
VVVRPVVRDHQRTVATQNAARFSGIAPRCFFEFESGDTYGDSAFTVVPPQSTAGTISAA